MNRYAVRTDLTTPPREPDSTRLLDWAPDSSAATIQLGERSGSRFLHGWRAPRAALDLFVFGCAIYCADKTSLRADSNDVWTREIEISVPVDDPLAWGNASFESVLDFLTGDQWTITPRRSSASPLAGMRREPEQPLPLGDVDAVSLFSGGLDSLTGIIDLLESDRHLRLGLLSHNEGGQASSAQTRLLSALQLHYGSQRIQARTLFLRPAPSNAHQARPLPEGRETTTRARSFLFLTTALCLAASAGDQVPVYIPENGFIGINVPLTRARAGSYSTRTTHPHYIKALQQAAARVGVSNPVLNPFRLKTKGEILQESLNPELLQRLAPMSVSCSHPEAARYASMTQGNCGYCFPCLIRRSSMATVGWDEADHYNWDALTGEGLLDDDTQKAADLRAVISGVFQDRPDRDIIRNGPIPDGEHRDFLRVWRGGLGELRSWFDNAQGATLDTIQRLL